MMANKALFKSASSKVKRTNTRNEAGGRAYKFSDEHALCQYVATGTFNGVFYASAGEQLDNIKKLVDNVHPELIAKAAVYGHETARMKDVPAYLLAVLAAKGELELLRAAFPRVITNVKMLLNFVQIVRSGQTGRRSFGSAVRNVVRDWFNSRSGNQLFIASIGHSNPSLVDTIKLIRPRPQNEEVDALFGYLLGREYNPLALPPKVKAFEAFKADNSNELPDTGRKLLRTCLGTL